MKGYANAFLSAHLWKAHLWKFASVAGAFVMVLALAVNSAEASGDAFGDSTADDGGISGNASDALGAPDGSYVEVGTAGAGGGTLTVSLDDNVAFDGPGADILVHAVAAGNVASATISVSDDGVTFVSAGVFADTSDAAIDLDALGLDFATAVRITYSAGDFPGYNLDAVEALNGIGENTLVDATPAVSQGAGFTSHTVTAHVSDDAVALAGVPVRFLVAGGPNTGEAGLAATDASGDAEFTYTGDGGPGVDLVVAWLDIDGNGALDAGEPSDQVTREWFGDTGTIEIEDVDGGGLVVGDLVRVTVEDRDLDVSAAPDVVNVLVTSTTDGVGFTLALVETGNSTGVFTAEFEVGDTTNAAALVLGAAVGDQVTATYDDALDGEGNDPAAVSDSLTVEDTEEEGDRDEDKVAVCHRPPGNPDNSKTIYVGGNAPQAHLAHGDTLGECEDAEESATQQQEQEQQAPTKREQQLDKFCERKPDHKRCDDWEPLSERQAREEDDD